MAKKDEKVAVLGGVTAEQAPGVEDSPVVVGNEELPTDATVATNLNTTLAIHDIPDLNTKVKTEAPAEAPDEPKQDEAAEPQPNAEDDGFLARAADAGFTDDDVAEMGRQTVERIMAAEDRRIIAQGRARLPQQQPPNQQPVLETPEPEIDLTLSEELSEEDRGSISKWAKAQAREAKALKEKLAALESRITPLQAETQTAFNRRIEAEFGKMNPGLFGQGSWESVDASCQQNRERLVNAARALNTGRAAVGLPPFEPIEAMKRAYSAEFYTEARKQVQNKAVSKLTRKIEQQSSQIIGRPQTAKATSGLTPYEETVKYAAERMGHRFDLAEVRAQNDGLPVEG